MNNLDVQRQISLLEKACAEFVSKLMIKTYNANGKIVSSVFLDHSRLFYTFSFNVMNANITMFHDFSALIKERIKSAFDFGYCDVNVEIYYTNPTISIKTVPIIRNCKIEFPTIIIDKPNEMFNLDVSSECFEHAKTVHLMFQTENIKFPILDQHKFHHQINKLRITSLFDNLINPVEISYKILTNADHKILELELDTNNDAFSRSLNLFCQIVAQVPMKNISLTCNHIPLASYIKIKEEVGDDPSPYELYSYCLENGLVNE